MIYGGVYLRHSSEEDTERRLETGRERGFPGMLGSIDCMHWEWKNCPKAFHEHYKGKEKAPTLILEVVADYELWIWHAFFGLPGSLNDINVLNRSPVFSKLSNGDSPEVEFTVNNHTYKQGYYLADGKYPPYAALVKTIPHPSGEMESHFAAMQEGVRKDVERAFGVLQARFAIITRPVKYMNEEDIGWVMKACIVLHNMIIEDERGIDDLEDVKNFVENEADRVVPSQNSPGESQVTDFLILSFDIRDKDVHDQLQQDLMINLLDGKREITQYVKKIFH